MAIVVPSRFALLKIVEDDYRPKASKATKNAAAPPTNPAPAPTKKGAPPKKREANAPKNKPNKKKAFRALPESPKEREESDHSDAQFAEQLQKALRLSVLESEHLLHKSVDSPEEGENQSKSKGKKRKTKTTAPVNEDINCTSSLEEPKCPGEIVPPSMDELKGAHIKKVLEEKNKEILQLKSEIVELKEELLKVKSRNKKLCSIIGNGEMKDKAEILAEAEKLREIQSELTNEVAMLHAQLEQSKSKESCPKVEKYERNDRAKENKNPLKKAKIVKFDMSKEPKK